MPSPKNGPKVPPVNQAWFALTYRVAAIVGSSTALISLLCEVPVTMASARGALAWLAVRLLARATAWLLSHTAQPG